MGLILFLLALLPGAMSSHQDVVPVRVSAIHQSMAADHTSLAFYKQGLAQQHKGIGHPPKQSHKKHRNAHRMQVAIASVRNDLISCLDVLWGTPALRSALANHPYLFFREITPPPPKDC